jgi:hypothetical protein
MTMNAIDGWLIVQESSDTTTLRFPKPSERLPSLVLPGGRGDTLELSNTGSL